MLWIKRNLFLAIGGVVALVLVASSVFYLVSSSAKNRTADEQLAAARERLKQFFDQVPFPDKTNVASARAESQRLLTAVTNTRRFFAAVPYQNVKDVDFTRLLDNTVDELTRKANANGVELPVETGSRGYAFSFQGQRGALKFPEGSFPALPQQLAEVKAICNALFDARITHLLSVRRAPLGLETAGSTDYHNYPVRTNQVTQDVIAPYEVTFACFSKGLSDAMQNLYTSQHGLIIKPLLIEPLGASEGDAKPTRGGPPSPPGSPPGVAVRRPPPGVPGPLRPPPRTAAATSDEWITFVEESHIRVTLLVELVKSAH